MEGPVRVNSSYIRMAGLSQESEFKVWGSGFGARGLGLGISCQR